MAELDAVDEPVLRDVLEEQETLHLSMAAVVLLTSTETVLKPLLATILPTPALDATLSRPAMVDTADRLLLVRYNVALLPVAETALRPLAAIKLPTPLLDAIEPVLVATSDEIVMISLHPTSNDVKSLTATTAALLPLAAITLPTPELDTLPSSPLPPAVAAALHSMVEWRTKSSVEANDVVLRVGTLLLACPVTVMAEGRWIDAMTMAANASAAAEGPADDKDVLASTRSEGERATTIRVASKTRMLMGKIDDDDATATPATHAAAAPFIACRTVADAVTLLS
jgi:hypothetical protein